jgi:hypothetical protein
MAYAVLPWRRSWSAERYAVLLLDLQRLAGTRSDEVALQLGEHNGQCAIALPIGVRVSMPISVTISRQPCSSDRRISRAKSRCADWRGPLW